MTEPTALASIRKADTLNQEFLRLERINKVFGANTVVRDVNMAFNRGEFISLLGPSGCGKTTILRMIAGFETPTSGRIIMQGNDITHLKPNQRKLGMVFQSYALFPNLNVADNIGFGLKVAGMAKDAARDRVAEMLKLIGLPAFGARYPFELSGGQQQRVALARAIAPSPAMLLLDEPLSALDAKIRVSLRDEIRAIQRELGITTIFVTHDQEEALSMSDRIVVMNVGHAEQIGTPFEIYNQPKTPFVASFVGTLNLLKGRVNDPTSGSLIVDGQEIFAGGAIADATPGETRTLALRPEAMTIGRANGTSNNLDGTIDEVHFLGSVVRIRVKFAESAISLDTFNKPHLAPPQRGQKVTVNFGRQDILVMDGRTN